MNRSRILGVIHTSPATVDLFGRLVKEALPGTRVFNLLDDSILPELNEKQGQLSAVSERWATYAAIMAERQVNLILNACSSIGELCELVAPSLPVDIVRVDEAMAHEAVGRGTRIGVVATLTTTLRPTVDLIRSTGAAENRRPEVRSVLVDGAYDSLIAGDGARHDTLIRATLDRESAQCDVVVLAQASMSRVAAMLPASLQSKILSSPPFAVADVVRRLSAL
jgi:Asp/Glu/hydantoin racemase